MKPFRFGVLLSRLPADGWVERLRHIEMLGYSTAFWCDHFSTQWDPVAALAAAAAVTKSLRIGSLVYGIDYRHPVVLAKAAATIHLLSGGRHEFGLGAGWMRSDYDEAGLPYDRPSVRIDRMDEALQIIRHMWTHEKTSFLGKYYQVTEIAQAAELPEGERPLILVGGGGRKLLTVAGRHADIVGINNSLVEGKLTANRFRDVTLNRLREKIGWVWKAAEAAGRSPGDIELNTIIFQTVITDDPKSAREAISKREGITVTEVAQCPLFLIGSASEIQEQLKQLREETGISYIVILGKNLDSVTKFGEMVVKPLT